MSNAIFMLCRGKNTTGISCVPAYFLSFHFAAHLTGKIPMGCQGHNFSQGNIRGYFN